jgi:hypothetical protein
MPLEKATMPDWTTSVGNGADSVANTPESMILSEVALFRDLPAAQLSTIRARLRRRTFPAGAHVITVEKPGETVYIVLEGSVKVYVTRPDGTEVVLAALGRGELIGEMSLADSLSRSALEGKSGEEPISLPTRILSSSKERSSVPTRIPVHLTMSSRVRTYGSAITFSSHWS